MGKRARSAHRAASYASARPAASTAASRQSRDASIDERMAAITAQSKYSQPRITRVPKGRRAAEADDDVAEDDIDRFHSQRDFIALDPRHDADERDEDEEELANSRVLDLPDRDEEDEEAEQEEEPEGAEVEEGEEEEVDDDDGADAFRPVPVDDLLDVDDNERRERSLAAERRLTTAWGRQKKLYYSADTVDFELESDEDIALAEEEEATRIRQETLAHRKPSDYTLAELLLLPRPSISQPTPPPSASAPFSALLDDEMGGSDDGVTERVERTDDLSEEEKLRLMVERVPEVLGLLEDLKGRMEEVQEVKQLHKGRVKGLHKQWLKTAELVLMMYCSCGLMFLAMKGEGKVMQTHPINQQLLALRMQLTRLMALKAHFVDESSPQPQLSTAPAVPTAGTKAQSRPKRKVEEEEQTTAAADEASEDDQLNGDDDASEGADEEDDEEPERSPPPAPGKVDIFSSLPKPSSKPRAIPTAAAPTKPAQASSLPYFDDAEDDGDLPLLTLPRAKKAKAQPTITPTPLPRSLHPDTNSDEDDADADADADGLAYYNQVAQARQAKLDRRSQPPLLPPSTSVPDTSMDVVQGKRAIGRLIEKNEGLKATRPRDRKTPKTRNRARYEKALIRRRSQVREYKGQGGAYGGEATGIKRNVSKSVRIAG